MSALRLGIAEGDIRGKRGKVTVSRFDRQQLPFFARCTAQPGASFADLDAFIRAETGREGHLSQFWPMGADEDAIAGDEEWEDDEFSAPASTRVTSIMKPNAEADIVIWEFDLGSPSYLTIVALGTQTPSSSAPKVAQGVADALADAAPPAAAAAAPASGVSFDNCFPQLHDACVNREGCVVLGKGDHPYCIAHAFNCGGNLADVESEPRDGLNGALEELERGCYNTYSLRDLEIDRATLPSDAVRDAYDFAALHPKIAKFVSMTGRKRYIQVGDGRGGPFAKACTGDGVKGKEKVVWQSRASAKRYDFSVARVLREMEAALP